MDNLTEKEREAYETLAINVFSVNPPTDKKREEFTCPQKHCKALISEFDISCKECGAHFSPCIASGQSILAKQYYTCKTCKHKALENELTYLKLKHCPLCHGKINLEEAAKQKAAQRKF
jgi:WD repeat-containing protein 35